MIENIAYKLFGKLVKPYIDYFEGLGLQLRQAKMKYSVEEYVSLLFFSSLIAFIVVMLAGSFYVTIMTIHPSYAYTFSIIISLVSAAGTFILGYYYPGIKGRSIKSRIEKSLPFATIYMSTAASSDVQPAELFKIVSMRGGEIGKECERIYRDIHMLGMDLNTALTKAANRTPSNKFAELLWGMISVINRGGDLGEYLAGKSREFMGDFRRSLNDYSKQISFYTEIYITLIIVGTLFFIVLSSIMSPLVGGDILFIQTLIVFVFVPVISAIFLFLLKNISPMS